MGDGIGALRRLDANPTPEQRCSSQQGLHTNVRSGDTKGLRDVLGADIDRGGDHEVHFGSRRLLGFREREVLEVPGRACHERTSIAHGESFFKRST